MTDEEFEYWWNVIYKPKYTIEDLGGISPSRKIKITINFPAIPNNVLEYIEENLPTEKSISINFMYHGNNGTRNKNNGFPIDPRIYDEYRNSKMIFINRNDQVPKNSRWSILGIAKSGKKQGTSINILNNDDSFIVEYIIEIGHSLRHRLNRWLLNKQKWIEKIKDEGYEPTSYHSTKFKYYFTVLLHFGLNIELSNDLYLPKFLDPTYIEVDSNTI